jgi:hypothetical protein
MRPYHDSLLEIRQKMIAHSDADFVDSQVLHQFIQVESSSVVVGIAAISQTLATIGDDNFLASLIEHVGAVAHGVRTLQKGTS